VVEWWFDSLRHEEGNWRDSSLRGGADLKTFRRERAAATLRMTTCLLRRSENAALKTAALRLNLKPVPKGRRGRYAQNDNRSKGGRMGEVTYVSRSRIERKQGPLRLATNPGEAQPVVFSVHGATAEHYKVDPTKLPQSHASTIDYVIAATAG